MLTSEQEKKIAGIVNSVIDIPGVPEFVEQIIFEQAVHLIDEAIQNVLPEPFKDLLNTLDDGIDRNTARQLADRLVVIVNEKVNIPILNEDQEARLFRIVIDIIVKGMTTGRKLDNLLKV